MSGTDYTGVTEVPGTRVTRDAASMSISRYDLVRRMAAGCRVLEVACGSGQGLGYVRAASASMVGGDITPGLLDRAHRHYQDRVPLVQFDAHHLPFADGAFDLVQIHEATYYLRSIALAFDECRRVLAPGGALVVSSINPEWADFNPSPHAERYLTARELDDELRERFAVVTLRFGFPVDPPSLVRTVVSLIKRVAVRYRLVPRTMRGKTLLKRAFLGPLVPMPSEWAPGLASVEAPHEAPLDHASRFRIIYAVARR